MHTLHVPAPWELVDRAARLEPLLAGLWRHRGVVLSQWPNLPLPTYAPADRAARYVRLEVALKGGLPINNGLPAGPGPFVPAAALILLWERWSFLGGCCPACGGDVPGYFFGGINNVGSVNGLCVDCGKGCTRFLPGFPYAMAATQSLLAGTPWTLAWTPLAFRLGGNASSLRAVLSELGVKGLTSNDLLIEPLSTVAGRAGGA